MSDILPPAKVFLHPPKPLGQQRAWETLYGFKEFEFPEYGFLSHYYGRLKPNKGMPYTEALEANNTMKKVSTGLLLMVKPTRHFIRNGLYQFQRLAEYLYYLHYFHARYYNDCSRELFGLIYRFFRYLGIDFNLSYELGRTVAMHLEYENYYRFIVEDILTATTKEKLLLNPRKELKRLKQIYLSREKLVGEYGVDQKFLMVFKLLDLLLLVPRFKKAFKFALLGSEFKNLQFDEIETYWADRFNWYNFGGLPREIRQLKQGFKLL